MGFFQSIINLLRVDDSILDEQFTLDDRGEEQAESESLRVGSEKPKTVKSKEKAGMEGDSKKSRVSLGKAKRIRPRKVSDLRKGKDKADFKDSPEGDWGEVHRDLERNKQRMKEVFNVPLNADVIIREFNIALQPQVKAIVILLEGMTDKQTLNTNVLMPLMLLANMDREHRNKEAGKIVKEELLTINQIKEVTSIEEIVLGILSGMSAIFVDGYEAAFLVETKGYDYRQVEKPNAEMVVRGPQESFNENLRSNTALIRRRLQTHKLVTEIIEVGTLGNTSVAILYIRGVVNPKLVFEIKRRIKAINVDFIADSGVLEQFLDDSPRSLMPKVLSTERPDRAAAFLAEGNVVILLNNSPWALIAPVTFFSLLHSAEDYYAHWPIGGFLRIIRFTAFTVALLLPAMYLGMTNYHPEMIPTELMLAGAASREAVPFPVIFEVLLMEVSFELIREAGVRIPSVIGPTIGIVGALILGQAAVAASIISPILVIVVSLTALGSFSITNQSLALAVRVLRFVFIALAAVFGFFGIALGLVILVGYICGLKTFGAPFMSPVAPYQPASGDIITLQTAQELKYRPRYVRPLDRQRMASEHSRKLKRNPGEDSD